jgi:hypothetical protein
MAIKVRFQGNSPHRYRDNPLELAFAEGWQDLCSVGKHLEYLLSKDNRPDPVSDRDQFIANTVIQWLGSPVGQSFLSKIMASPSADNFLKYLLGDPTIKDKIHKLLK